MNKLAVDINSQTNRYNSIKSTAKETMELALQQKTAQQQERAQKLQDLGFFYQYTPE
jgi:hypothetical protein